MINGDTLKQLLARPRYILAKKPSKWTIKQRTDILFKQYPALGEAYHYTMEFRNIYKDKTLSSAKERFECLITKLLDQQIKGLIQSQIQYNPDNILNSTGDSVLKTRNTNANTESFNSKIKLLTTNLRGVTDITFFLFRLHHVFAQSPHNSCDRKTLITIYF